MQLFLVTIIILLAAFSATCRAQDIIVKLNSEEIECSVSEILSDVIVYSRLPPADTSLTRIGQDQVFMILYANGNREYFTHLSNMQTEDGTAEDSVSRNCTSMGFGIGATYSFAGLRFQHRFGIESQLAIYGGVGFFPESSLGFSTGVKYYVWGDLYASLGVGPSREVQEYEYINGIEIYRGTYVQYGPHVLFGGDWHSGSEFGFGVNIAIGADFPAFKDVLPTMDIGIFLKW